MTTMHDHALEGCRPVPLAHYLKALAVLRLVSEQVDATARGCWVADRFVLHTRLDEPELCQFFLEQYVPTPMVAPWNGGSGFYPKDRRDAIEAIACADTTRLLPYRTTIHAARAVLTALSIEDKVDPKQKPLLLEALRAALPDSAVDWLDATFALSLDRPRYPPLLGTGGNDGRLDFTNNVMQRLLDLIDPSSGAPVAAAGNWLQAALFDRTITGLPSATIGQFHPGGAGGANAGAGFEGRSVTNPWDFVLMLEGSVCFAAAVTRRQEQQSGGALAFPFTVRQTAAGYGSAATDDESSARAEMWLPLWSQPASYREIGGLLSEGRAQVGGRAAVTGVDFARAAATLGVDRGIESFQRIGFQVRNGLAYFATPLSRVPVSASPSAALLQELDGWLDRFFGKARSDKAPASVRRAAKGLEGAIMMLAERSDAPRAVTVLLALGACERVLARSQRWAGDNFVKPIPSLSPHWLTELGPAGVELRLAMALGSLHGSPAGVRGNGAQAPGGLRYQLEPVVTRLRGGRGYAEWRDADPREVTWRGGGLLDSMNRTMARRLLWARVQGAEAILDRSHHTAGLADVAAFVAGRVNDQLLDDLIWSCALIDWHRADAPPSREPAPSELNPGADYALAKLCYCRPDPDEPPLLVDPKLHRLASVGRSAEAARTAIRRLRGRGFVPAVQSLRTSPQRAQRVAASLLFPISARQARALTAVLRPDRASHPTPHREQGASQ